MSNPAAFDAFERGGWANNSSEAYAQVLGPVTQRVVEHLLDAARVRSGSRVLDVATGPGYVASRAASRGAQALGVDLSAQMLELARRANPTIAFEVADAQELPFPAGQFDAVVANFLILHLGEPERAVAGFARVLRPGGHCALTAWGPPDRARLFGIFGEAVRAAAATQPKEIPSGPDFYRFASDLEFKRLLEDAGFHDVAIGTIDYRHLLPDTDYLWSGMSEGTVRTRALLRLQPNPVRTAIRRAFDQLMEQYRTTDGTFEVPVSVKLASGRR
jgi:ubiquinone/menaquinone biosynthesis C-methylase UbiE